MERDGDSQQSVIGALCLVGLIGLSVFGWWVLAGNPCPPPLPDWSAVEDDGRSPTLRPEYEHLASP